MSIYGGIFRYSVPAYYPESEVVGYPVAVEKAALAFPGHTHIPEEGGVVVKTLSAPTPSKSSKKLEREEDEYSDTFDPLEEEKMKKRFKKRNDHRPSFADMHGDDPTRRPSINVYQSIDDDHPDLQSIQNLVANMTFGADLD